MIDTNVNCSLNMTSHFFKGNWVNVVADILQQLLSETAHIAAGRKSPPLDAAGSGHALVASHCVAWSWLGGELESVTSALTDILNVVVVGTIRFKQPKYSGTITIDGEFGSGSINEGSARSNPKKSFDTSVSQLCEVSLFHLVYSATSSSLVIADF